MPGGYGDDPAAGGRYEYEGQVDPNAPSVTNGQITPAQWQQYQARRRRAAILGTLLTLGGASAGGWLSQALRGAGGAAGGMPPGYVPGWEGNTNLLFGAGGAGGAGAAGAAAGAGAGAAGAAGAGGAAAGAGAGAAGSAAGNFLGMSAQDWLALAGAGAGAVGGMTGGGADQNVMDPSMKRLLDSMQRRLERSEPLYDSVLAMANGLLPTRYQR